VLVLANADGSPSVAASSHIGVNVPSLVPVGSGLLVAAGLAILIAFLLIYVGASGLGRHHGGTSTPPIAPAGPTGPPPAVEPPSDSVATAAPTGTSS
jgi:hypothetical protein